MNRRQFLSTAAFSTTALGANKSSANNSSKMSPEEKRARQYLQLIMPSPQEVTDFICGEQGPDNLSRNDGWHYDAELGWTCCDSSRITPKYWGINESRAFFTYESDGARKVLNSPDKPCRIHTYGDSLTHCDQVNDAETWQEYLAGHLREPVRNYGIGGYSVYQAYLRMLRVEKKNPAQYIILNIFDDDHYRNLDNWRAIRFGKRRPCGYTLPYLSVNLENNTCQKHENLIQKPQDVYNLCDEDFVYNTFKDDHLLKMVLAATGDKLMNKMVEPLAVSFGIPQEKLADTDTAKRIKKMHTAAALYATQNIVTWTENFCKQNNKKLMIILSFRQGNIANELKGRPKFDQTFVDWLKNKTYPVIDMRNIFTENYKYFKTDIDTYLKRYYIGHHTPEGNFLVAKALRKHIINWLTPKPDPYRT